MDPRVLLKILEQQMLTLNSLRMQYGALDTDRNAAALDQLFGRYPALTARTVPWLPAAANNLNLMMGDGLSAASTALGNGFLPAYSPDEHHNQLNHHRCSARHRYPSPDQLTPLQPQLKAETKQSSIVAVTYLNSSAGSTIVTRLKPDGRFDVRLVYSRDFILAASASPYALFPPRNIREILTELPEVVAPFPKSFYNTIRSAKP